MKLLVLLNTFWAVAAITFDWAKIIELPAWAIIFIVICPLYPILLWLTWFILDRKRSNDGENDLTSRGVIPYLIAFAALPSAVYGVVAIYFYPIQMIFNGFNWLGVASIAWIAVYSVQGWWLLKHKRPHRAALRVAGIFLLASLLIQLTTKTMGYLNISAIPYSVWLIEMLGAIIITWLIVSAYTKELEK